MGKGRWEQNHQFCYQQSAHLFRKPWYSSWQQHPQIRVSTFRQKNKRFQMFKHVEVSTISLEN